MVSITPDALEDFLTPYCTSLPVGAVLSGRAVAPGLPDGGCEFRCLGQNPPPVVGVPSIGDDTLYNIGSTSKTFTSTMLAWKLGGDPSRWGNVSRYLSFLKLPSNINTIPLSDIVGFASGFFPDDVEPWLTWNGSYDLRPIDTLSMFQDFMQQNNANWQCLPQDLPGEYYSYSDLSFGLLGLCLSGVQATTDDPAALLNTELVNMLGQSALAMPNTKLYPCLTDDQRAAMVGFNGTTMQKGNLLQPDTVMYAGSGGITSTLGDMGNWLLFNMGAPVGDGTALPKSTQKNLSEVDAWDAKILGFWKKPIGWGWFATTRGSAPGRMYKNGAVRGFTSLIVFKKWASVGDGKSASDTGAVVLANFRNLPSSYPRKNSIVDASSIGHDLMNFLEGIEGPKAASIAGRSFAS